MESSSGGTNVSGGVDDEFPARDEQLARVEIATLALILAVTVVGNALVLSAILFRRRAKISRMYFYIFHLSIADLVTALFNVLPQLAWELTYRFRGGNALCKAVKFGQILGPYLSSIVLVLTAVDRYFAICQPLAQRTWPVRRARALVCAAWALALACCTPQLFIFSFQPVAPGSDVHDCWGTFPDGWGERAYVTWYGGSVFLLPLLVLLFTYTAICKAIWRNYNAKKMSSAGLPVVLPPANKIVVSPNGHAAHPRVHSMRGISRAKMKTVKLTVVVIACYVVCSSPFICAQLWATWDPEAIKSPFWSGPTFTILTLLASLNSCVNPWVYLLFNPDLAAMVRQQVLCRRRPLPVRRTNPGGGSNSSDSQSGSQRRSSRYAAHLPLLLPGGPPVRKSLSDPSHALRDLTTSASVVMIATADRRVGQFV